MKHVWVHQSVPSCWTKALSFQLTGIGVGTDHDVHTVDVHVKRLRESLGGAATMVRDGAWCGLPSDRPG